MSSSGPSNGGSDTADERKQLTYSEQLDRDKKKKQREEAQRMERENRGGNQVVQAPTTPVKKIIPEVIAPTTAEVSQVTATDVTTPEVEKEDDITIRKRKAKARGRSPTILTGVTGVTGGLTLGKPSLLGR